LVKRAREGPRPPPPPAAALSATAFSPSSSSTPLSLRRDSSSRSISASAPVIDGIHAKKPALTTRPDLLDINFSIHSATLARVGIFVAVVVVLLLLKHYSTKR